MLTTIIICYILIGIVDSIHTEMICRAAGVVYDNYLLVLLEFALGIMFWPALIFFNTKHNYNFIRKVRMNERKLVDDYNKLLSEHRELQDHIQSITKDSQ